MILYGVASLLVCWRVLFIPIAIPMPELREWAGSTLTALFGTLYAVRWLARRFARIPRRRDIREAPEHVPTLRRLSASMGVRPPRLVVDRSTLTSRVRLRGWGENMAIVVSRPAAVGWARSSAAREVHMAHELGHVYSKDLHLYYRARSVGTVSSVLLLVLADVIIRTGDSLLYREFVAKLVLLGIAIFVSLRSYIRFREHVADVAALLVVDDLAAVRAELVNTPEQSAAGRLIATHPSRSARLAKIFNPLLLMKTSLWDFLSFGISVGLLADAVAVFVAPIVNGAHIPWVQPAWTGVLISAALIGSVLSRTLVEQFVFHQSPGRATAARMLLLFIGMTVGVSLLNPFRNFAFGLAIDRFDLAIVAAASFLAALLTVAVCVGVVVTTPSGEEPRTGAIVVLRIYLVVSSVAVLNLAVRLLQH